MKTLKSILACTFILFMGCQKESLKPTSISSNTQTQNTTITHFIGEHFGGGIIFYLSKTGEHGLIAATEDLKNAEWYNGEYHLIGTTYQDLWKGGLNTKIIIQAQGKPGNYAALRCSRYAGEGYTDWYLPSLDELQELRIQKDIVGGFASGPYWSSSEYNYVWAWSLAFSNGIASTSYKDEKHHVRAIRAF
jgi:hypothetical protein